MWLGMMSQAGLARFDPKTEKFRIYSAPEVMNDDGTPKAGVRMREVEWLRAKGIAADDGTGAIEIQLESACNGTSYAS